MTGDVNSPAHYQGDGIECINAIRRRWKMTPKTYSTSTGPIQGLCKQSAIWGSDGNNAVYPLCFLQRPKWIKSDEAWEKIVSSIRLDLPIGTEIE